MHRFIEELSMNAWPAIQTCLYDGWVLRVSGGYTKRANSVNPLYCSSVDLIKKIQYCKEFYSEVGLPTVYKITSDSKLEGLDNKLEGLGYARIDETSVRVMNLEGYSSKDNNSTEVSNELTEEWINGYTKCSKIENKRTVEILKSMLSNIIGKTIWIIHRVEGQAVGFGYGVIDKGYVGIFDIYVDELYRGKGYGNDVMNKIISEAKELGANKAYLQVVVGNNVAENLYRKLGFEEIYKYWYRKL
jgi:GNAT superfamily N-acetyltransferase